MGTRSVCRLRAGPPLLESVFLRGLNFHAVALDQRHLRKGKDQGQRQHAKGLERDPLVGGERAPDELVDGGKEEKEQSPAERQLVPARRVERKHRVEQVAQQRPAEIQAAEQDRAEQHVDDGRLQLDEQFILQPQRQAAEHQHHHARDHRHDRQMANLCVGDGERQGDRDHEGAGGDEDRLHAGKARDRVGKSLAAGIGEKKHRQRSHFKHQLEKRRQFFLGLCCVCHRACLWSVAKMGPEGAAFKVPRALSQSGNGIGEVIGRKRLQIRYTFSDPYIMHGNPVF